jgi:hypothetical protein
MRQNSCSCSQIQEREEFSTQAGLLWRQKEDAAITPRLPFSEEANKEPGK